MEEWRDISGHYQGVYQVSNKGRIKRILASNCSPEGYILKPQIDQCGYPQILLKHDGTRRMVSIHRLVADAFLGPAPGGMQVNHKNGIKDDNRPENLEWMTPGQNMQHFHRKLRKDTEWDTSMKLSMSKAREIRKLYRAGGYTYKTLGQLFGVGHNAIARVIRGEAWVGA